MLPPGTEPESTEAWPSGTGEVPSLSCFSPTCAWGRDPGTAWRTDDRSPYVAVIPRLA